MTTAGTVLAGLICTYVLLQCYVNNQAYNNYCDSATTASGLNLVNGVAAFGVLCLLFWSVRPTGAAGGGAQ